MICLPWMVRNKLALDRFTLKSNFGAELRIGNNPLATASPAAAVMDLHPTYGEFALYRKLGESGYVAWRQQEALTFIQQDPAVFLKLVTRRVLIFWTGAEDSNWTGNLKTRVNWSVLKRLLVCGWSVLGLAGLAPGFRPRVHMLLLLTVISYPLPYYLTHSTNRYRLPLDPVLAVLAAHTLIWTWQRWRHTRT